MIKRYLPIMIVAALVSAGLLFAGTALIDRITPAHASNLPALVIGSQQLANSQTQANWIDNQPIHSDSIPLLSAFEIQPTRTKNEAGEPTPLSQALQNVTKPIANGTEKRSTQSADASRLAPGPGVAAPVMISDLHAHPDTFSNQTISFSGLVTRLDQKRYLINDGTGQMIIIVDDSLNMGTIANGTTLKVTGIIRIDNHSPELNACLVQTQDGTSSSNLCPGNPLPIQQTSDPTHEDAAKPLDDSGSHSGSSSPDGSTSNTSGGSSSSNSGSNTSGQSGSSSGSGSSDTSGSNKSGGDDGKTKETPKP